MQIQSTILQDVLIMQVWELKIQKEKRNITMYLFVKIAGRPLLENGQANLPEISMLIDVVSAAENLGLMQAKAIIRF